MFCIPEAARLWAGFTIHIDRVRQLHESFATRFYEPNGRGGTLVHAVNLHLGEAQPRWDLQKHVDDVLVGVLAAKSQCPTKSPPQDCSNPQQLPTVRRNKTP